MYSVEWVIVILDLLIWDDLDIAIQCGSIARRTLLQVMSPSSLCSSDINNGSFNNLNDYSLKFGQSTSRSSSSTSPFTGSRCINGEYTSGGKPPAGVA